MKRDRAEPMHEYELIKRSARTGEVKKVLRPVPGGWGEKKPNRPEPWPAFLPLRCEN
jgi:hypothetical protein